MRVVLDTNIYVSALTHPAGSADEALQLAALKRYELAVSPAILAELANVLTRKFDWDQDRAIDACKEMAAIATVVRPTQRLAILRDAPDNRILEAAEVCGADRIVTGDKHLLAYKKYGSTSIVTLASFLREISR